ncbi:sigma factor-like helix-turn-helix DNA-binding protein [Streptomyces qinzhouensis]|uniref:Helix-turn-helix domain-containing protein n=1 Tax=Streptomyces qinzhouensis TaxID=2599401 RepID=A0A5B8JB68_9ACTN|nr:sigma factor-like helix-turn-helix DNA-binding protein [Streptomyces qinzhouensis]QDY78616.1 helix-turn-helix domain-containing protein [Streptomyces qinzhouensis]
MTRRPSSSSSPSPSSPPPSRPPSQTPLPAPKERRRLREERSMSEEQIARALGVTKATVRAWESGRGEPRGRRREAYAKLLAPPEASSAPARPPAEQQNGEAPLTAPAGGDAAAPGPGGAARPDGAADPTGAPASAPASTPVRAAGGRAPVSGLSPAGAAALAAARGPAEAFDALYAHCAPGLVRQTYLLTGRLQLAHESVERAFHIAWQQWPDIARDRDPVGWVRSAAYELALSPWHRLRPAHRHADSPPLDRAGRELLAVLLHLPPPYRRTVLLYDGLGLDLPETAAETEASTPAAANRLLHARAAVAAELPELADPEALRDRLAALLTDGGPVPQPAPAADVRTTGERRAWFWTRLALTVTVVIMSATGMTLATAPTRYIPEVAPGQRVGGVPGHAGPQRLTPRDMALREMLRAEPAAGPGRLVPEPR